MKRSSTMRKELKLSSADCQAAAAGLSTTAGGVERGAGSPWRQLRRACRALRSPRQSGPGVHPADDRPTRHESTRHVLECLNCLLALEKKGLSRKWERSVFCCSLHRARAAHNTRSPIAILPTGTALPVPARPPRGKKERGPVGGTSEADPDHASGTSHSRPSLSSSGWRWAAIAPSSAAGRARCAASAARGRCA